MITALKTTKKCLDTLMNLYEKKAPTQKRDLKNKLCNMNMERDETVSSFFTNISEVKDQIASIDVEMDEDFFLQAIIEGLLSSWETFLATINGREEKPNFDRLWHDCIQEKWCIHRTNKGRNTFTPKKSF